MCVGGGGVSVCVLKCCEVCACIGTLPYIILFKLKLSWLYNVALVSSPPELNCVNQIKLNLDAIL